MPTVIVKSNASQGTDVTINDVGVIIPNSGGTETFVENDEIKALQGSIDLRDYLVDDAHGAGSSTLILNDGSGDLAQTDALNWLDTIILPDGDSDYGIIKTDAVGQVTTDIDFDGTAAVGSFKAKTNVDLNSNKLTNVSPGVAGTDGVNLDQVSALIAEGVTWKEAVLVQEQLDSTNDALSQAGAFYLDGQPSDTNTFTIYDGATTETFTFLNSPSVAFDVQIGGDADATMANLVSQINTDSTLWSAVLATGLDSINDGSGTSTAGNVVVIYRTNNSAADSYADRFYGTLGTQAFGQYVNFNGEFDYTKNTSSTLSTVDPLQKEFGFGRATVNLTPGETHRVLNNDLAYTWDADALVWQLSQGATSGSKNLHFGQTIKVPGSGTLYLKSAGGVLGSAAALRMIRAGTLQGASIQVDQIDGARAYKLSVQINGAEVESVALPVSTLGAVSTAFSAAYASGDLLRCAIIRTSGTGASLFDDIAVIVEYSNN